MYFDGVFIPDACAYKRVISRSTLFAIYSLIYVCVLCAFVVIAAFAWHNRTLARELAHQESLHKTLAAELRKRHEAAIMLEHTAGDLNSFAKLADNRIAISNILSCLQDSIPNSLCLRSIKMSYKTNCMEKTNPEVMVNGLGSVTILAEGWVHPDAKREQAAREWWSSIETYVQSLNALYDQKRKANPFFGTPLLLDTFHSRQTDDPQMFAIEIRFVKRIRYALVVPHK